VTDHEFDRVEEWGERVDGRVKNYLLRAGLAFCVLFGAAVIGGIWWASSWVADTGRRIDQLERSDDRQADQASAIAVMQNRLDNIDRQLDGVASTQSRILDLLIDERRQP